jgi:hypothetical protein
LLLKETLTTTIWDEDVYSSSSSSDSEDEQCPCKRTKMIKIELFVEKTVAGYHDKTFQAHFRMNRNLVYRLIGMLSKKEQNIRNNLKFNLCRTPATN